ELGDAQGWGPCAPLGRGGSSPLQRIGSTPRPRGRRPCGPRPRRSGGASTVGRVRDLAGLAVEAAVAAGAAYADARAVSRRVQRVATKNGDVDTISDGETEGIGVRALVGSAWGFACDRRLSAEGAREAAIRAVAFAQASGAHSPRRSIELLPVQPEVAEYASPVVRDPIDVPLDEKIALCLR